uniref:Uncharacterized protein n=1 Tax=Oryza nivara TaxID=4536 RepID=A0A0E0FEW5_ORYNI
MLRPAEFEESLPAPCLATSDVLDSPSVPATASQAFCAYRFLCLCLLRVLGSKTGDDDPDGASSLEDEAVHKHYQQQKHDVSSRKQW